MNVGRVRVWQWCVAVSVALVFVAGSCRGAGQRSTSETDPFFDDWEAEAAAVSDGDLRFLASPPQRPGLRTSNRLTVTADSLVTGWVALSQCQSGLDALPAVEITYRYQTIRDLGIVSTREVGNAEVDGQTVQLTNVGAGAEVCVRAEVQVLKKTADGGFEIRSGPFYRRFLDGYYPAHLDYRLRYPEQLLAVVAVSPDPEQWHSVQRRPGELTLEGWFEGKLAVRIGLTRR
jgi:hypothetical protein